MSLYSLNKVVQDDELNRSVFNQFKKWGRLLNVKVLRDWQGRPYAFVQFESVEDSQKALQESQGMLLNGRNIRCETARVNRTLCLVSDIFPFDESYLRSRLAVFGEIENVFVPPHHLSNSYSAFVKFHYRDDAILAFVTLKGPGFPHPWLVHWTSNVDMNNISFIMNQQNFVDKQWIFIGNLTESMTEESLAKLFCHYGTIAYIQIIRKSHENSKRVFAFIRYQRESEAMAAIQHENGKLFQNCKLYVSFRKYSLRQTHQFINQTHVYNPYYMLTNSTETTPSNKDVSQTLPLEYCYSPYGYYMDNHSPVYYVYPNQY